MRRLIRLAAVHLALAAMALHALVPAGWMPSASAAAPLVICTMHGPLVLPQDLQKHKKNSSRAHDICPFAAAPSLGSPIQAVALAEPSVVAAPAFDSTFTNAARPSHRTPQSPRGPPDAA
jgi:hypothetical protein